MAKRVKIQMNDAGVVAMLSSAQMDSILIANADRVARSAGEGYEAELGTGGKTRSRAFVRTTDYASRRDNARNASLLRALGGG